MRRGTAAGRRGRRRRGLAHRGAASGERGFALIAVLLVLTLLGVIGTEFAYSMRLEASMVRSYRDGVIALNLAEAGVQQAIREILTQAALVGTPDDEPLTFYRTALGPWLTEQPGSLSATGTSGCATALFAGLFPAIPTRTGLPASG